MALSRDKEAFNSIISYVRTTLVLMKLIERPLIERVLTDRRLIDRQSTHLSGQEWIIDPQKLKKKIFEYLMKLIL